MPVKAGLLAILSIALVPGRVRAAGGPERVFESLFGPEYRRVIATASKADDAALAGKVLKTAEGKGVAPALFDLLCNRAHDLGAGHRDGWETALRAMRLLARKSPGRRAEYLAKAVPLHEHVYEASRGADRWAAGRDLLVCLLDAAEAESERGRDSEAVELARKALRQAAAGFAGRQADIQMRIAHYQRRLEAREQAKELQERLAGSSGEATDADKARLIHLYVVELADPNAATRLGKSVLDAATCRKLLSAAAGPAEASEPACIEVGKWYTELAAGQAEPGTRRRLYRSAWGFYRQFLRLHKDVDVARAEAIAATKDMLARMFETRLLRPGSDGKATLKGNRPAELLRLPRLAAKIRNARLTREGLILNENWQNNCSLPCVVEGGYHVATKLTCEQTPKNVGLLLPVGSTFVAFVVGTEYPRGELLSSSMGTKVASGQPVAVAKAYEFDVVVLVMGGAAEIFAQVDGAAQLYWAGPTWALSMPDWKDHGNMYDGCVTLHAHSVGIRASSVKLRMLTGTARPLR